MFILCLFYFCFFCFFVVVVVFFALLFFEKNSSLFKTIDQFSFYMTVFQTSMKTLKKAKRVKAVKIKTKSKNW